MEVDPGLDYSTVEACALLGALEGWDEDKLKDRIPELREPGTTVRIEPQNDVPYYEEYYRVAFTNGSSTRHGQFGRHPKSESNNGTTFYYADLTQ